NRHALRYQTQVFRFETIAQLIAMIARRPASTIAILLLAVSATSPVARRVAVTDVPEAHAVRAQHAANLAQNLYRVLDVHLNGGLKTVGAAPVAPHQLLLTGV